MRDGAYKEASQTLLNGLDRYPDDYELNLMMGNCSLKLNDKKLSYFYLKKALEARPDDTKLSSQTSKLEKELLNDK
jgi:Tfp pilus assembly protein PilF